MLYPNCTRNHAITYTKQSRSEYDKEGGGGVVMSHFPTKFKSLINIFPQNCWRKSATYENWHCESTCAIEYPGTLIDRSGCSNDHTNLNRIVNYIVMSVVLAIKDQRSLYLRLATISQLTNIRLRQNAKYFAHINKT
jgi:hypothetical protein